jgi:putative tryptophan/tyrosine transport system substrate-binding protein
LTDRRSGETFRGVKDQHSAIITRRPLVAGGAMPAKFVFEIPAARINLGIGHRGPCSATAKPETKSCAESDRSIQKQPRGPKWLALLTVVIAIVTLGAAAQAQQPAKIPRIGYISGAGDASNQGPYVEALRQGLRDLGYIENKNFVIEFRGAEGKTDRYPTLVNQLVQLKVDVLVVTTFPSALIAKEATKTIPIVMVSNRDPVATGIVESLARPGANITGLATLSQDLSGKRLELLTEVIPRLIRVGIIRDPTSPATAIVFKEYEMAARALKLQIQSMEVQRENLDLESTFQSALKNRPSAIITITTSLLFRHQKQITELAIKHRLPSLFEGRTWVESGGLMSYSTDDLAVYRRAATYVDKILKGAKPADLPIEQPTKFEFVINLRTAKQIALTIPQTVLVKADRVIR